MKKNKLFLIIFALLLSSEIYASQVWKSMLLPGWGENKLGHKDRGKIFLLSEYIMWTSFMFIDDQYSSYRNDYRSHGTHYANVNWDGKNDLFAAHVGNYESLYLYNIITLQDGWLANYTDDNYSDTSESHEYYWNWEGNREERLKYDTWRNKSQNYDKAKNFIVAGVIINRIISVLDVILLERRNSITSEVTYDYDHTASLKIHYNF